MMLNAPLMHQSVLDADMLTAIGVLIVYVLFWWSWLEDQW